MSDSKQNIAKPVYKVVALQLAIVISFATVTLFFGGSVKGWSAAVGGAIAVIGSMTYAMLVVRGSSDAKRLFVRTCARKR